MLELLDPPPPAAPAGPRLRVALVGHACSPVLGSEPGLTWNWGKHLAADHDVTVFCHPQYRADTDAYLAANPVDNLRFVWVDTDTRLDPWDPAKGEKGLRLHYALWQRRVLAAVRRDHARRALDLVHHVCWGSLNQPPRLWKIGVPFVWGPVGGGQTWPKAFLSYADSARKEQLRAAAVWSTHFNPAIRAAAKKSALVLAKNPETARVLLKLGAPRAEVYFDNGITASAVEDYAPRNNAALELLWAGRLEARKGLPIALEAVAKLTDIPVRLRIAGDGPEKSACEALAAKLNLGQRVEFLGKVPWPQMPDLFRTSDAFLFTSLRDATGSVVLEAMAKGVPAITLDHQGIGAFVTDHNGLKVPLTTPAATVDGFAAAVRALAGDGALRERLSRGALATAAGQTWERRALRMSEFYREVVRAHRAV
jgi:glycosyltransferase involved in cell wall biosynthesis